MTDVTTVISSGNILQVDIGANPIVKVLNFLIDSVKTLDSRILSLENISPTHVTRQEHESLGTDIKSQISTINDNLNTMNNKLLGVTTDMKNLESKVNLTINDKITEILISTNMKVQSAVSSIDAEVQDNVRLVNDLKADVNEFINKMNKVNFEQLSRSVSENAKDISTIRKELETQKLNEFDTSKLNIKIDDDGKIVEQINQHSKFILELVSEINKMKEEMTTINDQKFDKANSVDIEENISKLRSEFDNNQNDLISAMKAIQNELQTIRDNADGLENLPQMDLQSIVESYFNPPYSNRIEKPEDPAVVDHRVINMADIPLVPVVKRDGDSNQNAKNPNSNIMLSSPISTRSSDLFALERRSSVQSVQPSTPVVVTEKVDVDDIVRRIRKEIDLPSIQDTFSRFRKEHNEAMSAVERKVDREYVERLFDKFRIIVHNLNDRFKELVSLNDEYATKEEVSLIVQVLKALPKESRPGTAVKKGPSCLFCGRPKTSVAGEISPRTAAMVGTAPVQNVTMEGNSTCEYIYGDGQAFRRDENFQSFPHLDVLPPLPQDKEEGTLPNTKNSTDQIGRVSFVKPNEKYKSSNKVSASSSSPTSRLQKVRK